FYVLINWLNYVHIEGNIANGAYLKEQEFTDTGSVPALDSSKYFQLSMNVFIGYDFLETLCPSRSELQADRGAPASRSEKWEDAADVNMVILKGSGEKAFCSGGDVLG
ncbi:hypothetical protein KIN20_016613, partial [Parelaphostrongylus tenuis]